MKNHRHALQRMAAFVAALGFALTAALPALAASSYENTAVVDNADILSKQTEIYVSNISIALQDTCGAQIGVYTTDYIGNSTMEGYAYTVYNDWGLGSKSADNGVLLLLSKGDDDYFVMRGDGLERDLSVSVIGTILDDELEPSWQLGDYDAGTQKTVRALAERLCSIYGVSMDLDAVGSGQTSGSGYSATGTTASQQSDGIGFGGILMIIIAILLVLWLVKTLRRNRSRHIYGASPPPMGPGVPPPTMGYGGYSTRRRGSGFAGSFVNGFIGGAVGSATNRMMNNLFRSSGSRRGGGGYGGTPGGFGGMFGPTGGSSSGSRPSGVGRRSGGSSFGTGRSGGGSFRSGGGSFRAGGGSSRGGGVGRRH